MKTKVLVAAVMLTSFLLATVTPGNAGVVTWTLLEDSSTAGGGPGADGLIGVPACPGPADDDDTASGESNSCNFSSATNCGTGSTPSGGSFSYGVVEMVQSKSCLGGDNSGADCIDSGDCPGGTCLDCQDNPAGWDVIFYMGNIGNPNGNGTMTICQDAGSSSYDITSMKMGASEGQAGIGPSCLTLTPGGGPNAGDACGVDVLSTFSVDNTTKIGACLIPVGYSDDSVTTARVIDVNDATPTPTCGYNAADIGCLQARALLKGAKYLLIGCSDQNYPAPSELTCFAGAHVKGVQVLWTADDASDCSSACGAPPGPCSGGLAEATE